eukprot:TRINITY_DN5654_c0_g1_i2.p1 TRINITY_DN5654_c0_g1~~TRINITY_DN5654_c0_g1_i2.p1  ORF type:complete len:129 (-),score=44.11 TRINITY_DN5654_c0_g1_i2:63-449(-)
MHMFVVPGSVGDFKAFFEAAPVNKRRIFVLAFRVVGALNCFNPELSREEDRDVLLKAAFETSPTKAAAENMRQLLRLIVDHRDNPLQLPPPLPPPSFMRPEESTQEPSDIEPFEGFVHALEEHLAKVH